MVQKNNNDDNLNKDGSNKATQTKTANLPNYQTQVEQ
jgi:hypothetical protein